MSDFGSRFQRTQRMERLVRDLADPLPLFHETATQELIALGPEAIPYVQRAARADAPLVRHRALLVVAAVTQADAAENTEVFALLRQALDEEHRETQRLAHEVLTRIGGPEARTLFLERLQQPYNGELSCERIVLAARALTTLAENDPHSDLRQALPPLRRLALAWLPDPRRRLIVEAIRAIETATANIHFPIPANAPVADAATLPVSASPEAVCMDDLPLPGEATEPPDRQPQSALLRWLRWRR